MAEFTRIGEIIGDVLNELSKSSENNGAAEAAARAEVDALCKRFPIYGA